MSKENAECMNTLPDSLLSQPDFLQLIFDSFPSIAMIIQWPGRHIVALNKAARKAGAECGTYCWESLIRISSPCPWCKASEAMKQQTEQRAEVEIRNRIWEVRWIPISEEYYLHYAHDITIGKQAIGDLKSSEEKFSKVFYLNPSACGLTRVDNGQYVEVNESFCTMFEFARGEVIGKTAVELGIMTPEARSEVLSRADASGRVTNVEMRLKTKTGKIKYALLSSDNIRMLDSEYRFTAVNDITERKLAEENALRTAKLDSIALLAGGIAHDFNNLLGGIYGFIDLAKDLTRDGVVENYLTRALSTIDRARGLTRQLLTFSKGGAPLRRVEHLFPFVKETTLFALSGSAVSCTFQVPEDLWPCYYDRNQIGQAIDNIVINAQQAMPGGGIIEVAARNILMRRDDHHSLKPGRYVRISITDHGIGISKMDLNRIFDPFFTTKPTGYGLGLATSHSIINRHGGCIDVDSEMNKGSTFNIYLPASCASVINNSGEENTQHSGNGLFLVMDDEEIMRDAIGDMLKSFGYTVECKGNGKEIIEYVKKETAAGQNPAGMIFDLTIQGGMGGIEAIQAIRKLLPNTPIFVSSGYAEDSVMANPKEYGFTDSIVKPFSKSEIAIMLNKYMRKA